MLERIDVVFKYGYRGSLLFRFFLDPLSNPRQQGESGKGQKEGECKIGGVANVFYGKAGEGA